MTCKRCNDMSPDGFDVDRLRKLDQEYIAAPAHTAWNGCSGCQGLSYQNVIDSVYFAIRLMPTDALMRELARRFL